MSPLPRRAPDKEVATLSSASCAQATCEQCSPAASSPEGVSPLPRNARPEHELDAMLVNSWYGPALLSPSGRMYSVMELKERAEAEPANIDDLFLDEEKWEHEATVLALISRQAEEEEEEEGDESILESMDAYIYDSEDEEIAARVIHSRKEMLEQRFAAGGGASVSSSGSRCVQERASNLTPMLKKPIVHDSASSSRVSSKMVPAGGAMATTGGPPAGPRLTSTVLTPVTASGEMVPAGGAMVTTSGPSPGLRLPTDGTISERKSAHYFMCDTAFSGFACRCTVAREHGALSCLDDISRTQFRRWHHETYGVTASGDEATQSSLQIQNAIHHKMWALKEECAGSSKSQRDDSGRRFTIREWKLDGRLVCRKAWMLAVGGSERMHRDLYSLVCRGHGPGDAQAQQKVKKMLSDVERVVDAAGITDNPKRGFAAHWWKNYLLLCDWLPNEQTIQIRGPSYEFLHKDVYGPAAREAGMLLSYKSWMDCRKEGTHLVAHFLKDSEPEKIRVCRSARHSK